MCHAVFTKHSSLFNKLVYDYNNLGFRDSTFVEEFKDERLCKNFSKTFSDFLYVGEFFKALTRRHNTQHDYSQHSNTLYCFTECC
jgi:hypothetical protein